MKRKYLIKHRLILSHFSVALSIFLVVISIFYAYTHHLLRSQFQDSMKAQLGSVISQVELEVSRMDTVLLNVLYSKTVKENYHVIGRDIAKNWEIMDAMTSINGPNLEVQQINAYTLDGYVVSAGFHNRMLRIRADDMPWFAPTLAQEGKRYLSVAEPGEKNYIGSNLSRQRYLSLYRMHYNRYNEPTGVVEVMRDVRYVFQSVSALTADTTHHASVVVLDPQGRNVFRQGDEAVLQALSASIADTPDDGMAGTFPLKVQGSPYQTSVQISGETGWRFAIAMPEHVIYRPMQTLIQIMATVSAASILLIFVLSTAMAQRIARPIKQLSGIVAGTTLDNLDTTSWGVESDMVEVDELANGFRHMTAQLSRSLADTIEATKQENQARMLALQAQMNPHFLYNSLTNISVMAEKNMNDGIVEMCSNISFMLRYVSSAANPVVSLRDEMDYVQKYLSCMKIRYSQYLHYTVTMEPGTEDIKIFKLAVQPLVENAIRHGIGEDSTWNIRVRAYTQPDGGWRVAVHSLGASFDEQKLAQLRRDIQRLGSDANYPRLSIEGMGLLNLYSRLRLFLQDAAVFCIENHTNPAGVVIVLGAKGEHTHGQGML